MFGSAVSSGRAMLPVFKGGFRTNNLDRTRATAWHLLQRGSCTFGIDEPMGYMTISGRRRVRAMGSIWPMHPILWSRITDRRLFYSRQGRRAVDLREPIVRAADIPGVQAADRSHHINASPITSSRPIGSTRTLSPSTRSSSRVRQTSVTA